MPLPLVARLAHWLAPRTYRDRVTMRQAFTPLARCRGSYRRGWRALLAHDTLAAMGNRGKMVLAASTLFRLSKGASARDVRIAAAKGIAFGIALAGGGTLALALLAQRPREIAARALAPILVFALVLVIVSTYRAIYGLESETSPAGWRRITVLICLSLCVVVLMVAAAIPIARWLAL